MTQSAEHITKETAAPKVSLVIPVRNEMESIEALIATIERQILMPDEVLLVDGGSTDATAETARRLTAHDSRFRIIEAGPATPGRGRNVGVLAATHDWIAFTDAGIELEPDWMLRLVEKIKQDPQLDVVYGGFEPATRTFFTRCAAITYAPRYREEQGYWIRGSMIMSSLIRKQALLDAGLFPDLRASEDNILIEELKRRGAKMARAPRAMLWWSLRPDFKSTFYRFRLYSYHNVLAGRQGHWHYGVLRIYIITLIFLAAAIFIHPAFALGAVLLLCVRGVRYLKQRACTQSWPELLNPLQFAMVLLLIVWVDAATLLGWVDALVRPGMYPAGSSTSNG